MTDRGSIPLNPSAAELRVWRALRGGQNTRMELRERLSNLRDAYIGMLLSFLVRRGNVRRVGVGIYEIVVDPPLTPENSCAHVAPAKQPMVRTSTYEPSNFIRPISKARLMGRRA